MSISMSENRALRNFCSLESSLTRYASLQSGASGHSQVLKMRIWGVPPAGRPLQQLPTAQAGPHNSHRKTQQNMANKWMNSTEYRALHQGDPECQSDTLQKGGRSGLVDIVWRLSPPPPFSAIKVFRPFYAIIAAAAADQTATLSSKSNPPMQSQIGRNDKTQCHLWPTGEH